MKNIVHVGAGGEKAQAKDTTYHYFEPRKDQNLSRISKNDNVNVYPYALSDYTGTGTINLTKKKSCSSFLEPNIELLKKIQKSNWDRFEVEGILEVAIERLDNILDSDTVIDKLILDTQGSELQILKGAGKLLHNTKVIVCEVEFVELYKGQPLFEDVKKYLTQYGFVHTKFTRQVRWSEKSPVFADAVFTKEII